MEIKEYILLEQELKSLKGTIRELQGRIESKLFPEEPYESAEMNEMCKALSKFQGEFVKVNPTRINPQFKNNYADLDDLMSAAVPVMAKYGLSWSSYTKVIDKGDQILHCRCRHDSGQWIESRSKITADPNPQKYGSYLTYHKRYHFMALMGISVPKDPLDDDGEEAAREVKLITNFQIQQIEQELIGHPEIATRLFRQKNITSLAELTQEEYVATLNKVRQLKDIKNGERKPQ